MGGWLKLLSALLRVWGPLQLALAATTAFGAFSVRGWPVMAILLLRAGTTALGVAAGLALSAQRPHAVRLTRRSLLASAAVDLFVYSTPYFPNNRMPGDTPFYAAASCLYCGAWLLYLSRSRRVRETFG